MKMNLGDSFHHFKKRRGKTWNLQGFWKVLWLLLKLATKQDMEDTKFVVLFSKNEIEETSMAINKLLAIWQF